MAITNRDEIPAVGSIKKTIRDTICKQRKAIEPRATGLDKKDFKLTKSPLPCHFSRNTKALIDFGLPSW
jgi:hypothetical protein